MYYVLTLEETWHISKRTINSDSILFYSLVTAYKIDENHGLILNREYFLYGFK